MHHVAWRSGNFAGCISEVTLHWSHLSILTKSTMQTQPPTLSGMGNEYQPKGGDALRLMSEGTYASFHLWINVGGTYNCMILCTLVLPERRVTHHKALYKSTLYFTSLRISAIVMRILLQNKRPSYCQKTCMMPYVS